MTKLQPLLLLV